jgi:hypothetical protein
MAKDIDLLAEFSQYEEKNADPLKEFSQYEEKPKKEDWRDLFTTALKSFQLEPATYMASNYAKPVAASLLDFVQRVGSGLASIGSPTVKEGKVDFEPTEKIDYWKKLGISPEEQKTLPNQLIKYAPDVASVIATPELEIPGLLKGASTLFPRMGKYITKGIQTGISQGGVGALIAPEGEKLRSGITMGLTGGLVSPVSQLALSGNPILRQTARIASGAGLGFFGEMGGKKIGEEMGLPPWMAATVASPLAGLLAWKGYKGFSPTTRAMQTLSEGAESKEATDMLRQAKELGLSFITPAEATGKGTLYGAQSRVGLTKEGQNLLEDILKQRLGTEQQSIEDFYRIINESPENFSAEIREAAKNSIKRLESERANAARPYYEKAETKKIAPIWLKKLEKEDPTIKNAIDDVLKNPNFQKEGELLDLPRNQIKVLDYAKREIDKQIAAATTAQDWNTVRVLEASKQKLLDNISKFNKDYAKARGIYEQLSKPIEELEKGVIGKISKLGDEELKNLSSHIFDPTQTDISRFRLIKSHIQKENPKAWDGIVRNEMERLMSKESEDVGGSRFFKNVLSDPRRYKLFQTALEDNPKALQQLKNMRSVFERLLNPDTGKSAFALGKVKMSKERNAFEALKRDLSSGKEDIKLVKFITDPDWQTKISELDKITDPEKFISRAIDIFGKTAGLSVSRFFNE